MSLVFQLQGSNGARHLFYLSETLIGQLMHLGQVAFRNGIVSRTFDHESSVVQHLDGLTCIPVSTLKRVLLGFKFSMKASNSCIPVIEFIVQTVKQGTRHIRIVAHVIDLVQSILIFLTSFIKVSLEDFEQVLSVNEFRSILQVQFVNFGLGFFQAVTFTHGLHVHLV